MIRSNHQPSRAEYKQHQLDNEMKGAWGTEPIDSEKAMTEKRHATWFSEALTILMIIIIVLVVLLMIFGFFTQLQTKDPGII
ncbi:hypothetical protein [uncultured Limosilactobacillus sp.]|uniref:hypothetical protein n=1 Tax=uncultured Limosilactobacillus sp. TaxID=2837629 RepID=UPI0025F4548C|nr:hypothetical protein [uncultured Limosilactobacillus sp.]